MTVNLCQISRKNHFRSPVCKNYSYFILQYRPIQAFSDLKMFFVSLRLGSEINSTWLITRLANQRARKTLFICALYTLGLLHQQKAHWHFELETLD